MSGEPQAADQRRPEVTKPQILATLIAGVPVVSNLLAAFGVYSVTPAEQHALTEAMTWGVVFGGLLAAADSHLRGKRNEAEATKAAAVTAAVLAPRPAGPHQPRATDPPLADAARAIASAPAAPARLPEPLADDEDLDPLERALGEDAPAGAEGLEPPGEIPPDEGDGESDAAAAAIEGGSR